jgi:hypothetical protein
VLPVPPIFKLPLAPPTLVVLSAVDFPPLAVDVPNIELWPLFTDVELASYAVGAPPAPTDILIEEPAMTEVIDSITSPPPPPFPKYLVVQPPPPAPPPPTTRKRTKETPLGTVQSQFSTLENVKTVSEPIVELIGLQVAAFAAGAVMIAVGKVIKSPANRA